MLLYYIFSLSTLILSVVVLIYSIKTITRFKLEFRILTNVTLNVLNKSTTIERNLNFEINQSDQVQAHVYLRPSTRFSGTENSIDPIFSPTQHSILYIDQSTLGFAQHNSGVDITQEGINILFSGLYFIYSNVNFNPNTTWSSTYFTYQTWFQYVRRHSANNPVLSGVLLRTVHTTCDNCTNSQETAYTGGVFYLQTGDLIQVCVSGQGLVDFGPEQTYLGLFLLQS
ncbi:CD40 ligand-like [Physella acuta]|uniref:CD40 ligand-like n=1 Tax=Physella acuta TaxID=109671 RepID=UPI0027DAE497|nr:CD40 ligand-like [Physella acuta]XP_059146814.1 CD40 ligand-like [Physella acuta]XP_059146815.1 CD40 ligand-like [Physella acuta]XP_059146816.1 CD40 ligand-like [Physella acuta]